MAHERIGREGPDLSVLVRDYGDVDAEVRAARTGAALFDFSFMARARLHGPDAVACLHTFQPRRVDELAAGRIAYSLRTDADGYVRTDLTTWRLDEDTFEVFSGDPRDIAALKAMASPDLEFEIEIEDLSTTTAILAVQGPDTPAMMKSLCGDALDDIGYFAFRNATIDDIHCTIGRLGYTGEKGIELITHRDHVDALWRLLSAHARPAGFAAIDRLRIEAGFILFANECRLPATPAEIGMQHFAGGDNEEAQIRLVGLCADIEPDQEPWQPATDLPIPSAGEITITSACRAPEGGAIGLGFVPADEAQPGRNAIDNANQFAQVTQIPLPIHDPEKRRPRGLWQ